jgi:hypothetical protein
MYCRYGIGGYMKSGFGFLDSMAQVKAHSPNTLAWALKKNFVKVDGVSFQREIANQNRINSTPVSQSV